LAIWNFWYGPKFSKVYFLKILVGLIYGLSSQKDYLIEKWLHGLILGFYNIHCIIIIMDFCFHEQLKWCKIKLIKIFKNMLGII